jgi:plastocyanin domain-containing protein
MKGTYIAIIVAVVLMIGGFMLSAMGGSGINTQTGVQTNVQAGGNSSNVSIVDGKQIIEIEVKGGYRPGKSVAKAGVPTIIRFKTNGTFDCSSAIRIPSLNVSQALPQTGATDIDAGTSTAGVLQGTCGMGMYRFEVEFRS